MRKIYHAELKGQSGHEAGRALLAQAFQEVYGEALPQIAVAPRGKPYFVNHPAHFSITHTPHHVFCVLSDRPVGIDAEELERQLRPQLVEKICSPRELEWCLAAENFNRAALSLWVLKEAAAKCTGEGLRGYPNHTDFDPADSRVTELYGCLVAVLEQEEDHAV